MPIIPTLGVKGRQQSAAESGSELSLFEMNKMSLWCFSSRAARQSMKAVLDYVIYHSCCARSLYHENFNSN